MKDEPGVRVLESATPRANVQTLRNLFNDKDAKCAGHVGSLKKSDGPAEVRIPRPSLAPKPSNKPSISVCAQQKSPQGLAAQDSVNLPRTADASRRASFERTRAAVAQKVIQLALQRDAKAAEGKSPTSEKRPSSAATHRVPPMIEAAAVEDENRTSEQPSSSLSDEEDYVTPISLSKPPPPSVSGWKGSIASPQHSEEAPSPVPPRLPKSPVSSPKQKLPEPPLYVPPQLVRHPVVPGWRRRELPAATGSCPPKPARPTGMCLPSISSPQGPTPSTAAQPDRPPLPGRSPPPVPTSRPPPLRLAVPKPPRTLPALPVTNESHEDEAVSESRQPTSPIPEYTEDEELGSGGGDDELYADTEQDDAPPTLPPRAEKNELYQDTLEDLYEEMPTDDPPPPVPPPPLTGRDNLPRKDKWEYDRLCKTFGLPGGWERQQPLDAGRARGSSSGGGPRGLDLPLHRGEPVYVLRMEHNPPGKWLVRNSQGEVGYADLANIEVDPSSIKFVMTTQRDLCANSRKHGGGTVQNDESDEAEAIYEETL
ncbi:uncharacterized protein LOC144110646 isoform X1 [Amblyomma americanum]